MLEGRKGCFEGVDIAFKQHSAVEDEPMLGDSAKNRQFCSSQLARQLAQRLISPAPAGSNETPSFLLFLSVMRRCQFDYLLQSPGIQTDLKTALLRVAGLVEQSALYLQWVS